MATRTGKVILAKGIKLDKNYKNIMDYSESSMVSLVQSKAIGTFSNCSFVRVGENKIDIGISYGQALQANYIAFQNPDYSNKWFFAFIDEVEYISNNTSRIYYTIDECSTWWDYWDPRQTFVVREHTNSDVAGNNTLDENVSLGEFIFNGNVTDFGGTYNMKDGEESYIAMGVTELIDPLNTSTGLNDSTSFYGGIYSGLKYMFFSGSFSNVQKIIDYYVSKGKQNAIQTIFYVPFSFMENQTKHTQAYQIEQSGTTSYVTVTFIEPSYYPTNTDNSISKPTTLAGYTPKNKKLLTYPYCFFNLTNNVGTECEYRYEDFNGNPNFRCSITISPSMSVKAVPTNYKSGNINNTFGEGIVGGKTPQCSWITDYYTNWLTQNAVNIPLQIGSIGMNAGANALSGNFIGGAMSLVGSIGGMISENYRASLVPDQVHGNLNSGDITYSNEKLCFTFIPKCIKPEYARVIDDYFTMFGYKTSRLKLPNQTGRRYWNFVQIAEGESIGFTNEHNNISIPSKSMDIINNAYQRGVTIWHNHDNVGNYALDNVII